MTKKFHQKWHGYNYFIKKRSVRCVYLRQKKTWTQSWSFIMRYYCFQSTYFHETKESKYPNIENVWDIYIL